MDGVMRVAAWFLVVPVVGFLGWHALLLLWGPRLEAKFGALVDFGSLTLGWRPNQFLVAPPDATANATPHATSPTLELAPADLASRLKSEIIATAPRTRILRERPDGLAFTAVQRSAVMRFPDFVAVEVRPAGTGATVLVYSRSVFGIRDFGVNRSRVEGWLAQLSGALKS